MKRRSKNETPAKSSAAAPKGRRDAGDMSGGTGRGTGGRFDEKRDRPFPESAPPYAGDHTSLDFDASRQGASAAMPTTDSGVDNAAVDEFTTGGNSLGHNAGQSRDRAASVSKTVHNSGRRPGATRK
jgi:hypothetical protein